MTRRTTLFLKESVVLVGFLNGVFLAAGVNPGATLLDTLHGVVAGLASGALVEFFFAAAPLAILVATLVFVWKRGGWLGLVAVAVAFLGGAQILTEPRAALLLLAVALGVGWAAAR